MKNKQITLTTITLNNGETVLVDPKDFTKVIRFTWCAEKTGNQTYAYRKKKNYGATVRMHQMIAGKPPKGFVIDHRNGSGLDNRRENLRFVSRALNGLNSVNAKGYWINPRNRFKKYVVERSFLGEKYYGGSYRTKREAEKATSKLLTKLIREAEKTGHVKPLKR